MSVRICDILIYQIRDKILEFGFLVGRGYFPEFEPLDYDDDSLAIFLVSGKLPKEMQELLSDEWKKYKMSFYRKSRKKLIKEKFESQLPILLGRLDLINETKLVEKKDKYGKTYSEDEEIKDECGNSICSGLKISVFGKKSLNIIKELAEVLAATFNLDVKIYLATEQYRAYGDSMRD